MSSESSRSPGPERTCLGCRKRAAKHELLRVVATELGGGWEVTPDPRGRAPGRGAHLHPTSDCLALALRRRAFARALRVPTGPGTARVGGLGTAGLERYVQQWEGPGVRPEGDTPAQHPHDRPH